MARGSLSLFKYTFCDASNPTDLVSDSVPNDALDVRLGRGDQETAGHVARSACGRGEVSQPGGEDRSEGGWDPKRKLLVANSY